MGPAFVAIQDSFSFGRSTVKVVLMMINRAGVLGRGTGGVE